MTGSQTLKLVHDRFKGKAPANVLQELTADMASAAKGNREISKHLGMAMEDLSALRVSFLLGDSTVFPSNQWFRVLTRYPTWRGAPAGSGNKRDEKQKQKKVMGETIVAASNASSMPSLALRASSIHLLSQASTFFIRCSMGVHAIFPFSPYPQAESVDPLDRSVPAGSRGCVANDRTTGLGNQQPITFVFSLSLP